MAEKANEALLHAATIGCLQDVKAALKSGADIDYAQERNEFTGTRLCRTALYIACFAGHTDIVRLLIRKGASLTKRSTDTSSPPLLIAASQGHTKVVDLLVQHSATLDTQDCFRRTPLMMACMFKRVDTARQLIELGARVDLADASGLTAQRYCDINVVGVDDVAPTPWLCCAPTELTEMLQEAMETKLLRCCNTTCGKPGYRSTLKLCGACKLTRYCSRDCQRQHWLGGHKKCCGHDAYSDEMRDRDFRKFAMRRYSVL
ncbi:uncharacterized protein LOC144907778 [Branchiostoma floridae x Branchiostoma belcheri]